MPRRRFGISIDSSLCSRVESVAKALNMNRSQLIEEAIRNYLRDLEHFVLRHPCSALIVVEDPESAEIERFLTVHKSVILNYSHHHVGNKCVYTILVQGDSEKLALLYSDIAKVRSASRRYVPLHH